MMRTDKKTQLKIITEDSFNGKVKIKPFRRVLKLHCARKCRGYITNRNNRIFDKMRDLVKNYEERTVALSSLNLFSDGDIASLRNGEDVCVCFCQAHMMNFCHSVD